MDLSTYKKKPSFKKSKSRNSITELFSKDISFGNKFSDKKKEQFYKQFSLLLKSNIDFEQSLDILRDQFKNKGDKDLILLIKNKVIKGKSLYEAMQETKQFSAYEYFSVKIGEESKNLEKVLLELQRYFDRKIKMKRQIVSVMTYPIFVLTVTFIVLYFMLNNVVPMFGAIFQQFGEELPSITKKIMMLSNNFPLFLKVFFTSVLCIGLFHYFNHKKAYYRNAFSKLVLKLPYFGDLTRKIYLSRFTQSLNLLLSSKTPLIISLELTEKMIGFYPIEISMGRIRADIIKGSSFNKALQKHKIFDHKLVSMVKVAEQINALDYMFENITNQYNEEIEHKTKMIGVVMEPVIILIIGFVVGVIMIAMYSPIFNLSNIMN